MANDSDQILSRLDIIDGRMDTVFTNIAEQGATQKAEIAINKQILESIRDIKGISKETMERMGELEISIAVIQTEHGLLCMRMTRIEKYAVPVIAVAIAVMYVLFR